MHFLARVRLPIEADRHATVVDDAWPLGVEPERAGLLAAAEFAARQPDARRLVVVGGDVGAEALVEVLKQY